MAKKKDLLAEAKKKRIEELKKKIKDGGTLTAPEIRELEKYELLSKMPEGCVSEIPEVAKALKVPVRTAYTWFEKGAPVEEGGYYNLEKVKEWKGRNEKNSEEGAEGQSFREVKTELARFELQKKKGELISRKEVEEGRVARVMTIKTKLLALPKELSPTLSGMTNAREIQFFLKEKLESVIVDFAEGDLINE